MDASAIPTRPLVAALSEVGHVAPPDLVPARLQLHHAAQVVAAVGFTFVPAQDDYGHTTLTWFDAGHLLVGRATPGAHSVRAGLSLPGLSLRVRSASGHTRASFDLPGHTLDDAYAWMLDNVVRRTEADAPADGLVRPAHDLPAHPVAAGETFGGVTEPALSELAGWYGAAHHALSAARAQLPGASEVTTWPHHFDMATLQTLRGAGEDVVSIGLGFSPGDGSIPEPYFYVTPWPYPDADALPKLPAGRWNTEGWTGAVLTGRDIVAADDGKARADLLAAFLVAAHDGAHTVLNATKSPTA